MVEAPCFENDRIHSTSVDELAARVIAELAEIGIIDSSEVIEWRHHLLRNAYPVYSLNYSKAVGVIRDALAQIDNLDLIGRAGLFFYSHLHDQLRFGKDYAKALMESQKIGRAQQGTV